MDNITICKKIAEIKGYLRVRVSRVTVQVSNSICDDDFELYNPLTDDALCFQLMLKNDIVIRNRGNGYYLATVSRFECDARIANKNPNKAILLAIIEAHKP